MPRQMIPVPPPTRAALIDTDDLKIQRNDLYDAATEAVGRLTVARVLLERHLNGEEDPDEDPGGWAIYTASEVVEAVITRLKDATDRARS